MKFVIQRVNHAEVKVDGETVGKIGKGFLVLIGVGRGDTREDADWYLKKLLGLRIFEDENGKTNLSLADVNGELLLVSQFTLYANCRKGNRPSFIEAGAPATYKVDNEQIGRISFIGPTRMDYSRIYSIINYMNILFQKPANMFRLWNTEFLVQI